MILRKELRRLYHITIETLEKPFQFVASVRFSRRQLCLCLPQFFPQGRVLFTELSDLFDKWSGFGRASARTQPLAHGYAQYRVMIRERLA